MIGDIIINFIKICAYSTVSIVIAFQLSNWLKEKTNDSKLFHDYKTEYVPCTLDNTGIITSIVFNLFMLVKYIILVLKIKLIILIWKLKFEFSDFKKKDLIKLLNQHQFKTKEKLINNGPPVLFKSVCEITLFL